MKSETEIDYVICTGRVQRPDSGEHMSDLNYHKRIIVLQQGRNERPDIFEGHRVLSAGDIK